MAGVGFRLKRRLVPDDGHGVEPVLTVTAVAAGVGSLVGLLFAAQVRARQIADANRRELIEHLRG